MSWYRIAPFLCMGMLASAAPSVQQVATLRVARAAHTATTLLSGDVLLVGGMLDGGGSVASVERFNPRNNSIREIGALSTARLGHTATLLRDGRVVIVGGYNGDYLHSIEFFDPSANSFRASGSVLEARSGHTATLLPDGRILLVGGVGRGWSFLSSAEIYDPATARAVPVGSMRVPREGHTATLLKDGRVLVVGGHAGRRQDMTVYASADIFSPASGRFESVGPLGTARHKHDAVMMADGRVLVIGGADRSDRVFFATTEIFDPRLAVFARGPSMANARYKIAGTSVVLPDSNVLITSGAREAEVLDVEHNRFRALNGLLPAAFRFAAAASLRNGDVIVSGGYDGTNHNASGVWRITQH